MTALRCAALAAVALAALTAPALATSDKGPAPPPGGYTPAGLGEALTKLGYDAKPQNGAPGSYVIKVDRGYPIHYRVSLSSDLTYLWMSVRLSEVGDPARMNPEALRRLLEENEKNGPVRFTYNEATRSIEIKSHVGNMEMTPARLRKTIDALDGLIRRQAPLWTLDSLVRIGSVPAEITGPELALLAGEWTVEAVWVGGTPSPADEIAKNNLRLRFAGDKFTITTGGNSSVSDITVDPRGPVKRIDAVQNGVLNAGIYRLEGDKLIIVFASTNGLDRPAGFDVKPGDKSVKYILKRTAQP